MVVLRQPWLKLLTTRSELICEGWRIKKCFSKLKNQRHKNIIIPWFYERFMGRAGLQSLHRAVTKAKQCWLGARRLTGAYLPQSHASKVSLSMSEQLLPEPALDVPIVFVDLETTGGSTSEHRITEVG